MKTRQVNMRRQRRTINYTDDNKDSSSNMEYQSLPYVYNDSDNFMQMERLAARSEQQCFENTLEAKVEDGDTLQALALRFHCSVSDIKRLNKIDKDNEIHARKVVKIPLTVHSVLLGTLPAVHKSGNNSPKQPALDGEGENGTTIFRNPLEEARIILDEKLLVASVNAGGSKPLSGNKNHNNNNNNDDSFHRNTSNPNNDINAPLLDSFFNNNDEPQLRPIRGPALTAALDCSGSDCDISWVFLFVVILAMCFVIPLLYVFYLAEHTPHKTAHVHNISIHNDH